MGLYYCEYSKEAVNKSVERKKEKGGDVGACYKKQGTSGENIDKEGRSGLMKKSEVSHDSSVMRTKRP